MIQYYNLVIFKCFLSSSDLIFEIDFFDFFRNYYDPDQARRFVMPDPGLNCLQG